MPDRPRNVGASARVRLLNLAHTRGQPMELLGFGDPADEALLATFREVMAIDVDDGVSFDLKGLRIETIRKEFGYGGSRIRTTAALAGARIPIAVDIGFGDAVEPSVEDIDLLVHREPLAVQSSGADAGSDRP